MYDHWRLIGWPSAVRRRWISKTSSPFLISSAAAMEDGGGVRWGGRALGAGLPPRGVVVRGRGRERVLCVLGARARDEGTFPFGFVNQPFALQQVKRVADGGPADAVLPSQLVFGRQRPLFLAAR